jgi:hypothetical protein
LSDRSDDLEMNPPSSQLTKEAAIPFDIVPGRLLLVSKGSMP